MNAADIFETETDLNFALLAADPFGYAVPADVDYCEFDVELDAAGDAIRNFFFVDS